LRCRFRLLLWGAIAVALLYVGLLRYPKEHPAILARGSGSPVFSADGRWLAVNTINDDVAVYDAKTGRMKATWSTPSRSASLHCWAVDCNRIVISTRMRRRVPWGSADREGGGAASGGLLVIWDPLTNQNRSVPARGVTCAQVHVGKGTLLTAESDGAVRIRDANSGSIRRTLLPRGTRRTRVHVALNADASRAMVVADGAAREYNLGGRQGSRYLPDRNVDSVAFMPDGRTAVLGHPGAWVTLWDTASGSDRLVELGGANGATTSVAPNGTYIASAQLDRPTHLPWLTGPHVFVNDCRTGRLLFDAADDLSSVTEVAVSGDGMAVAATASRAGGWCGVVLWRIANKGM
jgi:WD40 repeat protein